MTKIYITQTFPLQQAIPYILKLHQCVYILRKALMLLIEHSNTGANCKKSVSRLRLLIKIKINLICTRMQLINKIYDDNIIMING